MSQTHSDILKRWAPAAVWMSVIFVFSTELFSGSKTSSVLALILSPLFPSLSGDQFETIHLILRKLGHFSEYFIFAVLIARALSVERSQQSQITRAAWTIALAALYAFSDEWHQSFVPSRTASLVDVMIDSFGAICGTIWWSLRRPQVTAKINRP
jgi:VanZ family protein